MPPTAAVLAAWFAGASPPEPNRLGPGKGPSAPAPSSREIGNLVAQGVPEIPREVEERTNQYQNVRSAVLLDWDPAGAGVLVATRFAETSQVHFVSAPGAHREQLTFFAEPVTAGALDPVRGATGFLFQIDRGGNEFFQHHWFDRKTGRHARLTDGASRNEGLLVSNAGGRVAFSSTRRNGRDFDIYVRSGLDGGGERLVREVQGQWNAVDWSPDDTKLLLLNTVSINESYLHVLDVATGEARPVNPAPGKRIAYGAAAFARSGGRVYYSSDEDSEFLRVTAYDPASGSKEVLTPALDWDVRQLAVSRDGRWLAYVANEGGTGGMYLAPTAKPARAVKIAVPPGVIYGIRFDRQSRRLGLTLSTTAAPADVYSLDVATRKATRWTFSEVGGLPPDRFVSAELVSYPTFDGRSIPAWYYRPRAATADKTVPAIVSIHGGPEAQANAAFNPIVQYWVNELGAAVLVPNVRGSSGYGKSYLLLDNGRQREDSVKDVGALLDWVTTRPELDRARVAVTGGSYGGYMTLASMFLFPERLRCGVEAVGISNFVTFLERTEAYRRDLRRAEYGDERDPAMREFLNAISPTTNAHKIRQPLLVAQGQNDPRVPATEAEQIVATVRQNGGDVWYLLARDEGHGFQKKRNRDYLTNATSVFFERCLGR